MTTTTPELTEELRFESLEMVDLLGCLEDLNTTNEVFFFSVKKVFEHYIETKLKQGNEAFKAYFKLSELFRIAALRK